MPSGDTLTVGKHTTLQEVRDFVERAGDDRRIHGKYNDKTGETILYVGKKSPSLFSRIFGNWVERRETAKLAFFNVMDRTLKQTLRNPSLSDMDRAKLETLRDSIVESTNSVRGHSMRTGMIALLSKAVEGSTESYRKTEVPDDKRLLAPLGNFHEAFAKTANDLHMVNVGLGDVRTAGEDFGDVLAERFLELHGHDQNLIAMFVASNGDDFKGELREALKTAFGPGGNHLVTREQSKDFFDVAYDRMISKLLSANREVPDTSTPIEKGGGETVHLPNIQIGDTEYQPDRYLGSGSGTEVYAYRALDGSGKEIAFKVVDTVYPKDVERDGVVYEPVQRFENGELLYRAKDGSGRELLRNPQIESPIPPPTIDEIRSEIRSHAMLARGNSPNVLGLEGVVPLPGGQFGIAMEIAPGGDVLEFSKTLRESVGEGPGKITPEMAEIVRLTLIKDMAQGLDHIQNEQHSMHLDLKTPNVLIGNDGRPKISDFGLVREDTHAPMRDGELPDNPIWTAPELGTGFHDIKAMRQAMQEVETGRQVRGIMAWTPTLKSRALKDLGNQVQDEVRNALPKIGEQTIRNLTSNILKPDHAQLRSEVEITGKFDTWALGIMALDVWTGEQQFRDQKYFSDDDDKPQFLPARVRDRLREFGSNPNNRAIGYEINLDNPLDQNGQVGEPLFESTGDIQLDHLVNRLLDPTPQSRPKVQDVINDPVFNKPGVQSEQVYALIRAISEGDPGKIDEAKRALEESLRQLQ